jgi:hypothetical protein
LESVQGEFGVPNGEESDVGDLHGEMMRMDVSEGVLLWAVDSDEVVR